MSMSNDGTYSNSAEGYTIACELNVVSTRLYIYLKDAAGTLLIWNLDSVDELAFQGSTLKITYKEKHHLVCSGGIARQIQDFRSAAVQDKESFLRRHSGILLLCVFVVCLFVCGWLYLVPWLGERAAMLVPVETEIGLGEQLSNVYTAQSTMNDSASALLNEFTRRLKKDETYPIVAGVITSEEINAFALPGGRIFVYSGIISKMDSPGQLAALLGHEMTHVIKRHSLKSICRNGATSLLISSFFGDASGITSGILSQVNEFKSLDYSRDLETEADNEGLDLMVKNNLDPAGMLDLLQLLKEQHEEMPALMKYLSTHPDTEARIRNISGNPAIHFKGKPDPELETLFRRLKASL